VRSPPRRLCPLELELDEDRELEEDELDEDNDRDDDELEEDELEEDDLDDDDEAGEVVIGVGSIGPSSQAAATPATKISVPCESRIKNSRRACRCSSLI
jgi:hypothetical protein